MVAIIGDSTFYHSGITGLVDVVTTGAATTVIILDNGTTAMTGGNVNPGTGMMVDGTIVMVENVDRVLYAVKANFNAELIRLIDKSLDIRGQQREAQAARQLPTPSSVASRSPSAPNGKAARLAPPPRSLWIEPNGWPTSTKPR